MIGKLNYFTIVTNGAVVSQNLNRLNDSFKKNENFNVFAYLSKFEFFIIIFQYTIAGR